jgi:predicted NBD/HSP70 family sugar kinase
VPTLAVDLGGTFLRCGVGTDAGDVVATRRKRIHNFLDGAAPEVVWESIVSEIEAYAREVDALLDAGDPIVFSFPGPIRDGRVILAAPTVVGSDAQIPDLATILEARTRRPVRVLNDISAAAWYLSEHIPVDRFMVVTVSSGVGSKVFDRRHPLGVLDDVPFAGEIGHCVVDLAGDAPLCDCGGRGHLGAISSGRGTERLARRRARENPQEFALSQCARVYGATADTLNNEEHFVPAVRSHDSWAIEVMRLAAQPLAKVISAAAAAVGLQRVAIIGGFALQLGGPYIDCLRMLVNPASRSTVLGPPVDGFLTAEDMHPEACLFGAAAYSRRLDAVAL